MKKAFEYIIDTFTMIGCARAAAELSRMGHYDAAKNLILQSDGIKQRREQQKEEHNVSHSLLQ